MQFFLQVVPFVHPLSTIDSSYGVQYIRALPRRSAATVSRPARDRVILDSGGKTLTTDGARGFGPTAGYGVVLRAVDAVEPDPSLLIERLSEEHATVRVMEGDSDLRTGDLARVIPNHSCVVSNLVDFVWLVDGDQVLERLPVAARGRIT